MTDQLIILNRRNGYGGEGFFKFEDGYKKMTVAFKDTDQKPAMLYIDGNIMHFEKNSILRCASPVQSVPSNCGIFMCDENSACNILFCGDEDLICRDFSAKTGLKSVAELAIKATPLQNEPETGKPAHTAKEVSAVNYNAGENAKENSVLKDGNAVAITDENSVPQKGNASAASDENSAPKDINANATANKNSASSSHNVCENAVRALSANSSEIELSVPPAHDFSMPVNLKDEPNSFWDVNKEEFLSIFSSSPEDDCLSTLIPGSKWVSRENYVLGIIYDEYSSPMYLCYGFSLPWSETPPESLEGYSQWIPRDCTRPHENGYWVVYVNARTGERVR